MPDRSLDDLLREFERAPPAGEDAIEEAQDALVFRFPEEYAEFLRMSNGGEGFVGPERYLMLWPVEELPESNQDYEVDVMAPGLVLFGSSGGGTAYAFERDTGAIVDLPITPLDGSRRRTLADGFVEFLSVLAAGR
jgi:hypothetical protein